MSVSDVFSIIGKKVYDLSGRFIGEVKDVLIDESLSKITEIILDNDLHISFNNVVGAKDIVIIEKIEVKSGPA
ncbi:MAG: PRC-barrel domain-containing protein [Candidatus Korarchaeota archaeon]